MSRDDGAVIAESMSADQYLAYLAGQTTRGPKYGNQSKEVDGFIFDSIAEAAHYRDNLRIRELAGDITELRLQPRFDLVVNGLKITRYTADFSFRDRDGELHVQDVKSKPTRTRDYVMRRKLMKAIFGIDVEEVVSGE